MTDYYGTDETSYLDEEDEPAECYWESSVAPGDPETDTGNTVALAECNDCALGRLASALRSDPRTGIGNGYTPGNAPFSSEPLALNVVGLRISKTVSNKFDDRMVVFYRPVDLASPTTVDDPDAWSGVHVPAVETFLADTDRASPLRIEGNELPGTASTDTEGRECRIHTGWKVLVYPITTDPGWQKTKEADPALHVDTGEGGYLENGRAILLPGFHASSHRLHVHHPTEPKGYVALAAAGSLPVIRVYRGAYLLNRDPAKTVGEETYGIARWEALWVDKNKKRGTPGPRPDAQAAEYLAQCIGSVTAVHRGTMKGEVVGLSLTARFSLHEIVGPHRDYLPGTWLLSVDGLYVDGTTELRDDDVVICKKTAGGINLHSSNPDPRPGAIPTWNPDVSTWSAGCQVQKGMSNFRELRALYQLSKRARCPERAAGTCPSLVDPTIVADDVLASWRGNQSEWGPYSGERLHGASPARREELVDAIFTRRFQQNALGDVCNYFALAKDEAKAVEFHAEPASGDPPDPRPTLSSTVKRTLTSRISEVATDHLHPGEGWALLRKMLGKYGVWSTLAKKLEKYLGDDLACDDELRTVIEEARVADPAAKSSAILKKPEVVAAIAEVTTARLEKCLELLASELDRVTGELEQKQAEVVAEQRAIAAEMAAKWCEEGLEICDHIWACDHRLSYMLAEVRQEYADAVDERSAPRF